MEGKKIEGNLSVFQLNHMASVFAVRMNVSSATKATVVQLWPFSICHATHRESVLCDREGVTRTVITK